MVTYKRCTEVSKDKIYEAFQSGFSDYMIKMDLSQEIFIQRFFGPEGNSLTYSVIALDNDKAVGLNLGGIKIYEGIKTLRCGALCVHPDYRGSEVSNQLFNLHKEIAIENQCKQLFLEVIVGNDRAINFYKKMGYEKVYNIVYYTNHNPYELTATLPVDYRIETIEFNLLSTLGKYIQDVHINWQNDFDYISQIQGQINYGIYKDEKLVGGLSIHPKGKISFLWISLEHRNRGLGRGLLYHAIKENRIEKLVINFSNNANLQGFLKHLKFTRDAISQYEMYQTL